MARLRFDLCLAFCCSSNAAISSQRRRFLELALFHVFVWPNPAAVEASNQGFPDCFGFRTRHLRGGRNT
jgi:hypothetical protein